MYFKTCILKHTTHCILKHTMHCILKHTMHFNPIISTLYINCPSIVDLKTEINWSPSVVPRGNAQAKKKFWSNMRGINLLSGPWNPSTGNIDFL